MPRRFSFEPSEAVGVLSLDGKPDFVPEGSSLAWRASMASFRLPGPGQGYRNAANFSPVLYLIAAPIGDLLTS